MAIDGDGYVTNKCAVLYNIPDSARFYLQKADDNSYYIRFFHESHDKEYSTSVGARVLGVEWNVIGGFGNDSAVMHVQSDDSDTHKRFQIIPSSNGMYKIMNKESGKYWVLGDSNNNGMWDDGDRVHQSSSGWDWEIEIVNAGGSTSQKGNPKPYNTFGATSAAKEANDSYSFSYNGATVTSTNWMSALPDDVPITDLNIPGTHDTGTNKMKWNTVTAFDAQCQCLFVDDQLAAGVRYFDLRCHDIVKKNGVSSPKLNHTDDCVDRSDEILTSDDVMTYVRNFLADKASKNETIIFQISRQGSANPKAIYDYWKALVYAHPDWFYVGNHVPTLGEVRGKIVLLSKIPLDDKSFYGDNHDLIYSRPNGLTYQWALDIRGNVAQEAYETAGDTVKLVDGSNYEVWCEDDYKIDAETKWSRSTKPSLDKASKHRDEAIQKGKHAWNIIFTSCSALKNF